MFESDTDGRFQRQDAAFRDRIQADPDARFPAEPDRYHLYISRACPWAHGAVLVRTLLGLEDVLSMDVLDPYREAAGWQFTPEKPGCTPDTVNDVDYLAEIYELADPDYEKRPTVPVLWDRKRETIVNNESIEIMAMLADAFEPQQDGAVDLYPADRRAEIDQVVAKLYDAINNGVYRAGFADSQQAYDEAIDTLFAALDRWDGVLAEQRYLLGEQVTLADLRLFATLVRFDSVYHTHFKCNRKRIVDYPNLWGHTREIYQLPGVAETVNLDHIKEHYYRTHPQINPKRIVARGPSLDFSAPHDRDQLPGGPPAGLR
ncbi:glutathione S-transferase [Halodesulfurarchaeum formicicum]|uniref:Glutathione S-transferase n=1 Tax=Halodesulfurarchaeum formicicum TaxID=1873524 RepID=A0A1D8S2M1_9EURY|nr:glutathione S-transferase family protein [Halodesulfurarchaeum formicicum]AOW79605.1 glutathione S-transferase [Halodesulfurarchaeum formicicum]